jgi:Skp family chaperone for outer membrane proteins
MMPLIIGIARSAVLGLVLIALLVPSVAEAQAPPEVAEINACFCLQQALPTLSAEMNARKQALDALDRQLADMNGQLERERATINVDNPDAVARYKALLERRDAAYRQSSGPVHADATRATARYNSRVNEYNTRCLNRPFSPALSSGMPANLMCPPLQ